MGLLEGLFNKDNNEKIKELNAELKEKERVIDILKENIDDLKEKSISFKQVEIFEKNLKAVREENIVLKNKNEELSNMIKSFENKASNEDELFNLNKFNYRLPVEDFFVSAKYKEIVDFLNKHDIRFIQDFDKIKDDDELKKIKNYDLAMEDYEKFKNNIVIFDNRVLLCKGDKVSKIFKKSRKLLNYLATKDIEFMDDMLDFDFDTLAVKGGFTKLMVKEFKKITEEYFEIYKI